MARKLATIRRVSDIRPIDGADRIVVALIDGWECVVKKGEFDVGDKIVYIEVDSIVPERPEFEFLRERKFRVRTIKLMGQISQGLVLPMSILPLGEYEYGDDVTDVIGVVKYDPQVEREKIFQEKASKKNKSKFSKFMMRFEWYRKKFVNKQKSEFPEWIQKTDEARIQNLPDLFEKEKKRETNFTITEKMDGQSATYYLKRLSKRHFEFGVCSRNIHLVTPDDSPYWTVAKFYKIEKVLKQLIGENDSIILQGEICGTGIQGNKYHIDGYKLFVFNLIFPEHSCATRDIAKLLAPYGIKTVPILDVRKLPETISDLVEYSKGYSVIRKEQRREGIVVRNNKRNVSFKVINPEFLLAENE